MTKDLCDILVQAYCSFDGQITTQQISTVQTEVRPGAKARKFLSAVRLLTKYRFLKVTLPDIYILMPQGLLYVEENGLVQAEEIRRDQKLRSGLMRVSNDASAGNADAVLAWNAGMIAEGYTQEEIDGRHQYLHTLNLL